MSITCTTVSLIVVSYMSAKCTNVMHTVLLTKSSLSILPPTFSPPLFPSPFPLPPIPPGEGMAGGGGEGMAGGGGEKAGLWGSIDVHDTI